MEVVAKDEWLKAAMTDDGVVAEVLVRLKKAQEQASSLSSAVIPLRWGLRLPRSRPGMSSEGNTRCEVSFGRRKDKEGGDSSTRCSPTTPLSWSGGGGGGPASPSATADGFEETSRQTNLSPSSAVRSKDTVTAENACATAKKSRKKKTFSELKEEESSLLKERMLLKKEIATLRTTFKEQRSRNDNLKRMKLDLNSGSSRKSVLASDEAVKSICSQSQRAVPSPNYPLTIQKHARDDCHPQSDSSETNKATSNHDRSFLLPDLNMMPAEEDSGSETLHGMR